MGEKYCLASEDAATLRNMDVSVRKKKVEVADLVRQRFMFDQRMADLLNQIGVEEKVFFTALGGIGAKLGVNPNEGKWNFDLDTMTLERVG